MQRYTFQLSVGNKIKVKMDSGDVKEEMPAKKDTVKNIAENFEKQRKMQDTDTDRTPLYTAEEESKLLEKYKTMSNGKLDLYLKFFKQADKEKLGFLTVHQFAEAVRKRGFKGKDSEITDMFAQIDRNLDWKMSLEEYLDEMAKKDAKSRTEAEMQQIFRMFDQDKDGFISWKELKSTVQKHTSGTGLDIDIDAVMKKSDKDGDGKISFEDFMKSCKYRDSVIQKK